MTQEHFEHHINEAIKVALVKIVMELDVPHDKWDFIVQRLIHLADKTQKLCTDRFLTMAEEVKDSLNATL